MTLIHNHPPTTVLVDTCEYCKLRGNVLTQGPLKISHFTENCIQYFTTYESNTPTYGGHAVVARTPRVTSVEERVSEERVSTEQR